MSRRVLVLPIRPLSSKQSSPQWICRRCLATQSQDATPIPPVGTATTSPSPRRLNPSQPAMERRSRLSETDLNLKRALPQSKIPAAYLVHSTSNILHQKEKKQREETVPHKPIAGVVVSAGRMDKTVKVRVGGQTWNKRIKKVRCTIGDKKKFLRD